MIIMNVSRMMSILMLITLSFLWPDLRSVMRLSFFFFPQLAARRATRDSRIDRLRTANRSSWVPSELSAEKKVGPGLRAKGDE